MQRLESLPGQENIIILPQFYSLATYWLPIKFRISYKILLLTYKALNGSAPAYLTSLLSRYNLSRYNPSCSLRSQNSGLLVVPRIAKSTKGGRAFSHLAPNWHPVVTRNYTSFSLDPEQLRRDDANPSEDLRWCQPWNNIQNYQILL